MKDIEVLREALAGELETKNNRINWLLISQSFLFVAFGVIQRTLANAQEKSNLEQLSPIIPIFGIFLSILTLIGITGCYRAVYILSEKYIETTKNVADSNEIDSSILEKLIFKDFWSKWIGVLYSYLMCIGILTLWIYAYTYG